MSYITRIEHTEDLAFNVELQGHTFMIDADEKHGGKDRGPRPKALLLSGLAGCTGMDVVSLLKKMRMEWKTFRLEVEADQSEEHPKVYTNIRIKYIFTGDNLDRDKIEKAVQLSRIKCCGVSAILEKAVKNTYEIILNYSN